MVDVYRSTCCVFCILLASFHGLSIASAQESKPPTDFVKKQAEIKGRFEQRKGRADNEAVHKPLLEVAVSGICEGWTHRAILSENGNDYDKNLGPSKRSSRSSCIMGR